MVCLRQAAAGRRPGAPHRRPRSCGKYSNIFKHHKPPLKIKCGFFCNVLTPLSLRGLIPPILPISANNWFVWAENMFFTLHPRLRRWGMQPWIHNNIDPNPQWTFQLRSQLKFHPPLFQESLFFFAFCYTHEFLILMFFFAKMFLKKMNGWSCIETRTFNFIIFEEPVIF